MGGHDNCMRPNNYNTSNTSLLAWNARSLFNNSIRLPEVHAARALQGTASSGRMTRGGVNESNFGFLSASPTPSTLLLFLLLDDTTS